MAEISDSNIWNGIALGYLPQNRAPATIAAQIACLVIAYVGVSMRFVARRLVRTKTTSDDYAIVIALILFTAVSIDGFICLALGGGKHEALLQDYPAFAKASFAFMVLYRPAVAAIKLSVLLLYRRLFPLAHFRTVLYCYGGFVLIYTIVFSLFDIFHCSPVDLAWTPRNRDSCLNIDLLWIIGGSLNAVTDIVALCLPMPLLWKLQVTTVKRIQLMGIFLLGGFVCIVSIVRVVELSKINPSEDVSYPFATVITWSAVELGVGILCACLPIVRPIITCLSPYILNSFNSLSLSSSKPDSAPQSGPRSRRSSRPAFRMKSFAAIDGDSNDARFKRLKEGKMGSIEHQERIVEEGDDAGCGERGEVGDETRVTTWIQRKEFLGSGPTSPMGV